MGWITDHVEAGGDPTAPAQADATASLQVAHPTQPTIGASTMTPSQFAALPRAQVPITPQGLPAVLQRIMDPSSKLGAVAGWIPGLSALQAGKSSAQLLDSGHPGMAALSAVGALLPEGGGLLGEAEHEAAPFAIHEAASDHPTLAPRYEFTHPQTGQPNELVLAAEDGGKTLRVNNVGPIRTDYSTAATDANTLGAKSMKALASWLAKQHPQAEQLVGDRGDGRIASIDLTKLR